MQVLKDSKPVAATEAKTAPAKTAPARRMTMAKPAAKAPAKAPAKAAAKAPAKSKAAPKAGGATKAKAKAKATPKAKDVKAKAPKAEKVIVKFVPRRLTKGSAVHIIAEESRPQSGSRLFAHTHAALTLLNMLDPTLPAVPAKAVLTVMGQRAVSYHKKQNNFASGPDNTLRLTSAGYTTFKARLDEGKVDGGLANDFLSLFIDNKPGNTGISPNNIYQVGLG